MNSNFIKLITVTLFFNSFLIFSQTDLVESNRGKRIRIDNPTSEVINKLLLAGIDLRCGAIHDNEALYVEVTSMDLINLKKANISYEVQIDDLTKFYAERAIKDLPKALEELKLEKSKKKYSNKSTIQQKASSSISNVIVDSYLQYYGESEVNWATPSNFVLGSMGGCLTVSEMEGQLDLMRTMFPSLITVKKDASPSNMKTYGYSGTGGWSGKTVYYVKISDNPDGADDSNEPDILYTSMIHSRELSSLMGNIYFMWYLLENYATNPAIKSLVDNNELFFVPIVNPDGLKWNEKVNPNGGGMNRTNLRGFSTSDPTNNSNYVENYGVDPNRNFNYLWGPAGDSSGSSSSYLSSTYRGPSAFSEPESQIMRDFILSKSFKTAVWQHSYANAIPHPYGGIPTKVSGRENEMVRWHQDMTRYNRYIYGAQVLTPANGIADDWCLGGTADTNGSTGSGRNILATTPENGHYNERNSTAGFSGFWPTPSNIIPIAKRMMLINLMNAYYGGKYAKFHDLTQSNITSLSSNLRFGIERVGQTASNFSLTITPISSNIQSITSPSIQTGITVLEQRNVTAALVLKNTIAANEKIEYKVTLSNSDAVIYEAIFVKYYNPTVLFSDDPDTDISIANWVESTNWRNTTLSAWSGTSALKAGASTAATVYANNANNALTTTNSFDLSGASKTIVQFYAKWDLERNYDFVELLGSPNNGTTWYNLGGKYNKPNSTSVTNDSHSSTFSPIKSSTSYSFQSIQSSGLVYDGDQMDNWVMEEIYIDATNNTELLNSTNAKFKFVFRTDGNNRTENYSTTYDGFYFDDFKIIKVCDLIIPSNLLATAITQTSATINWSNDGFLSYDLRYRQTGTSTWIDVLGITTNTSNLTGLIGATQYEVQVRSNCGSSSSNYSNSITFTTLAASYCASSGSNTIAEYITNVQIGTINNTSGANGYNYFSSVSTNLNRGDTYNFSLTKFGTRIDDTFAVWIDYNKNGDFTDSGELVTSGVNTFNGSFMVPLSATLGSTRMRVSLKRSALATSCEAFVRGEVEDYNVNIVDPTLGIEDEILSTFKMYPNPVSNGELTIVMPNTISKYTISIVNVLGQKMYFENVNSYDSKHLVNTANMRPGIYLITVSTDLGKATKKLIVH